MRLTVVGCSGSLAGPDSAASCYLLEADGFRLVVDFGNGSLGALQRYAALFSVDAVCLSHLHADHCVDLYSYSIARTYSPAGPQPPIPVYGPAGTAERIGLIHSPEGDGDLLKRFTFETLEPGRLTVGPFDIQLAHVNHPVETFGFRFTQGGRTLAYTGDTGQAEAVPELAAGADVFLSEAAFLDGPGLPPDLHLTARQAAAYASQAGVGRLVLTHLQPWNNRDDARSQAAAAFSGELDVATTGQVIELLPSGATPCRYRYRQSRLSLLGVLKALMQPLCTPNRRKDPRNHVRDHGGRPGPGRLRR
jgi:ribonuclease BN (tRNA processing enzyme)